MHHRTLVALAGLSMICSIAAAQKTYTPVELRKMASAGKFPAQGSPTTKSESLDYAACLAKVESVISAARPNYPTRTIASTNTVRMEKLWTNDAAMTLTCSALDKKITITTALYQ
jgi:hypothetical protein